MAARRAGGRAGGWRAWWRRMGKSGGLCVQAVNYLGSGTLGDGGASNSRDVGGPDQNVWTQSMEKAGTFRRDDAQVRSGGAWRLSCNT